LFRDFVSFWLAIVGESSSVPTVPSVEPSKGGKTQKTEGALELRGWLASPAFWPVVAQQEAPDAAPSASGSA